MKSRVRQLAQEKRPYKRLTGWESLPPLQEGGAQYYTDIIWPANTQNHKLKAGINRETGKVRVYYNSASKKWEQDARILMGAWPKEPVFGSKARVEVWIVFYCPTDQTDIDGHEKAVLDILQFYAYANDKQVAVCHQYKRVVSEYELPHGMNMMPGIEVVVRRWKGLD